MPEPTEFKAPDSTKINWWYVGGGVMAVVLLIYVLNRNKGSTGTVAAGTSINAALGSIQEYELSNQGAISFAQKSINDVQTSQDLGFTNTNKAINTGFTGVNNAIAVSTNSINNNISTSSSGITDLINRDVNGINEQLGNLLGMETNTYTQLLTTRQYMEGAFGANSAQLHSIDAEIASIFSEMETGFKQLADELNKPVAVQQPPAASSSGHSSSPVHTYTVYLPGGGEIHTLSSTAAGALNNVPGGHF